MSEQPPKRHHGLPNGARKNKPRQQPSSDLKNTRRTTTNQSSNSSVKTHPKAKRYVKNVVPNINYVERINTTAIKSLSVQEITLLKLVLDECFNPLRLELTPFYQALLSGLDKLELVEKDDKKLAHMINSHNDLSKRNKLQFMFKLLEKGQRVRTPTEADLQAARGKTFFELLDIVPDLEKFHHDKQTLDLITDSNLNSLKMYIEGIREINPKHSRLQNPATLQRLSNILTAVNTQTNALLSFDIEAFEFDINRVTEIGLSIYDPAKDAGSPCPSFTNIHILVEENIRLRNGRFVTDHKDRFLGGFSVILPEKEAVKLVQCLLNYYCKHRAQRGMGCILVGHDVAGDIKWLNNMGVKFAEETPSADTQILYKLTTGEQRGLGTILRTFDIPHSHLHNAGNDAYYTLLVLLKLCDVRFRINHGLDTMKREYKLHGKSTTVLEETSSSKQAVDELKIYQFSQPKKFRTYDRALSAIFS